jgi:adenylyltransferase/sulfurtransferase
MSDAAAPDLRVRVEDDDDRFARFRLISWWDQALLGSARVLVVGAGALGNELLKNLALLGVGKVLVADMDLIEASNLARSVLYRPEDEGKPKALTAARAAQAIYPDMVVEPFQGNVCTQLGLGAIRWADVVLGGLDNREARLFLSRACFRVGTPFIDGAIEALQGVARVFMPGEGPCYACTLGEVDWKLLEARRACSLLTRDEMLAGRTPTTPTTSSVVAGIQCQEALKLLHGLQVMDGGFVFEGFFHASYPVSYARDPECPDHDELEAIQLTGQGADDATLGELLELGRDSLAGMGHDAKPEQLALDLGREVIVALACTACGTREEALVALGTMTEDEARCPGCGDVRAPELLASLEVGSPLLERTPAELGIPPWDVLTVRFGELELGLELDGDRDLVLATIAEVEEVSSEEEPLPAEEAP